MTDILRQSAIPSAREVERQSDASECHREGVYYYQLGFCASAPTQMLNDECVRAPLERVKSCVRAPVVGCALSICRRFHYVHRF